MQMDDSMADYSLSSPDGKRKRGQEEQDTVRESQSPGVENIAKRRAVDNSAGGPWTAAPAAPSKSHVSSVICHT